LCRRCERARPQRDQGPWVDPMAREWRGRPVCENFREIVVAPEPQDTEA
jgi:hypothetical protein